MSSISSGTTLTTALVQTADTSGVLQLQTNGTTTAVTIDTNQNFGLGVTPSAWGLGKAMQIAGSTGFLGFSGANGNTVTNAYYDGSNYRYISNGYALLASQAGGAGGQHQWYNAPSGTAGNAITFTQAMTLDANGQLWVGTVPGSVNTGFAFGASGTGYAGHPTGTASGTAYSVFRYNNNDIGSITQNGTTSVNFNGYIVNPSDQKLKTNIVDAPSSLLLIDKIQIRSFDWIAEEKNQSYGVIAQELETVFPEAVNAPTNKDGFYGVDYTKLVPMLVKAIQELSAQVTTLQTQVTALQSKG